MKSFIVLAVISMSTIAHAQQPFSINGIKIEGVTIKQLCKALKENADPMKIEITHPKIEGVPLVINITEVMANGIKLDDAKIEVKSDKSGITLAHFAYKPFCTRDKNTLAFKFAIKENSNSQSKNLYASSFSSSLSAHSAWKFEWSSKKPSAPIPDNK